MFYSEEEMTIAIKKLEEDAETENDNTLANVMVILADLLEDVRALKFGS